MTLLAQFLLNSSLKEADVDLMYMPRPIREENPLKKFAEASLEKPGMYLIALRAHLARGKTALGNVINSVAGALPHPPGIQKADEA